VTQRPPARKELRGVDVFVDSRLPVEALAKAVEGCAGSLDLVMITNRGQKVYPGGLPETYCVDHWRCRFQDRQPGRPVAHEEVIALLSRLAAAGLPFIKTEGLYSFDGQPGFSLGQGQ
jgi:isocitrate dehydrogenase